MSEKKVKICAAFFAHDGEGNFVFQKRGEGARNHIGQWDSGGGSLEWGETPEMAILRELKEEYGCNGNIDEIFKPTTFEDENGTWWIVLIAVVSVVRSDVYLAEPEKADELRWSKLDDLPYPLTPGVATDLETFKEELKKYSK